MEGRRAMAGEVVDDRGRRVPVYRWTGMPAREEGEFSRELAERMKVAHRGYTLALIVGGVLVASTISSVWGVGFWWRCVVWTAVGSAEVAAFYAWLPREVARRARRALVQAHRCASCGYLLNGVPRSSDGCVACPECGSAWRVGDGGRLPGRHG